ncbi:hypothetical protein [Microbacterium sp. 5K110]|jgi:drug/metabolite transporter (DMT)-like permease|uniref:hypothetical protein n=1 Tax=unclassified Microbacterium TaxID=2609290 RepID=UPI0010FCE6D9|nr:hypothetical protein [Microbacterium sp. 5K110]TLF28242.1 hypothetical protein FE256_14520 [Microbacterium sp. 5K110]
MTRRPWGAIMAVVAAVVFAAPTLFLPADSSVGQKLAFIVAGSVILAAAIVLTRAEPGVREPEMPASEDDVTR